MKFRFAFVSLLSIPILAFTSTASPENSRPNIIYLLADDIGGNDVGWRNPEIKTPHLDKLARSGATLDEYYVQPVCSPTRAALMTGRYPFRYGLQAGVVRPWAQYGLPLNERILPEALKEAGYETAITGKWHLGHFQEAYLPGRRGFDHQYGHYNGSLDYFTHIRDGGFDWHRNGRPNHDQGYSTDLIGKEAARLIRERDKSKPLFLYVPFNGVHAPHQVPDRYLDRYPRLKGDRRLYAAMISALDDAVGKISKAVDDEGIRKDTLILFSSDNGGPSPRKVSNNGKFRGGKGSVHDGGVKVAAFATWPGTIAAGISIQTPLHIVDWYPTLLTLAGAPVAQKQPVDGIDILNVLTEGKVIRNREILINTHPRGGAIRIGDWKLVVRNHPRSLSETPHDAAARPSPPTLELYHLSEDPREKKDVSADHPARLKQLHERYRTLAAQAAPPKSEAKPPGFKSPAVWGEF